MTSVLLQLWMEGNDAFYVVDDTILTKTSTPVSQEELPDGTLRTESLISGAKQCNSIPPTAELTLEHSVTYTGRETKSQKEIIALISDLVRRHQPIGSHPDLQLTQAAITRN